jgi:hypothetical protein
VAGEWFGQIPSWFGDFFRTIPDALYALWQFGDPSALGRGWWGVVIMGVWGIFLIGGPLVIARLTQGKHEWVSASMGVLAGLSGLWWVFGILPSAWIYYLDGSQEILEGTIIPASAGFTFANGYRLDIASNLYTVIRDLVVVLQMTVGIVLMFWGALKLQERFPRGLAEGETKPDPGGYR